MTTLTELERSPVLAIAEPVLARALHTLSNVRVRNVATIGGHLAHGDPHMDLPPIMVTLDARVRAVSPRGERWIDVADLITGYYETSLAGDELIAEVHVPTQPVGSRAGYAKFTALSADDWPSVGVAVWVRREGETIVEARIAVGGATDHPTRMTAAEALLVGGAPSAKTFADAARFRGRRTRAARRSARLGSVQTRDGARARAPRARTRHRGAGGSLMDRHRSRHRSTTPAKTPREPWDEVSRSVPRLEGIQKVTGAIEYIHHLRLPGMLYGKIVRSTVAHANIVSIDTTDARDVPGVYAVITGEDIRRSCRIRSTVRRFTISRALRSAKSITSANPSPSCSRAIRTPRKTAPISCWSSTTNSSPFSTKCSPRSRARRSCTKSCSRPARSPISSISRARQHTNIALDAQVRHGDIERGFAEADHIFDDYVQVGPSDAHAARADGLGCGNAHAAKS